MNYTCRWCGKAFKDKPTAERVFCSKLCRFSPEMLFDRFVFQTRKSGNGCVEWQGRRTVEGGYGGMEILGECRANRIAFRLFIGDIPDGLCVLHTCDNPPCVNPSHLFLGTHADNNKDRARKGRSAVIRGSKSPNAKLTEPDVLFIRENYGKAGVTLAGLAKKYRVDQSTIHLVIKRRNWRHL